ncbi:hypothetical protein ACP70R_025200 [Stipagrostis hirtigluma subsp. patula]
MASTRGEKGKEAMSLDALSSSADYGSRARPLLVDSSGAGSGRSGWSGSRRRHGSLSSVDYFLLSSPANLGHFVSEIPPSIEDDYWGGVATGTGMRCEHGLRPRRKMCWDGKDTGRRFLGCGLEEGKQCKFVHWCDAEHSAQVETAILALWDVVAVFGAREAAARKEKRKAWTVAAFFALLFAATLAGVVFKNW